MEIVALSSKGGRDYNEDVHAHWHDGSFLACLVADGAGGHGGGDVAASTASQSILGALAKQPACSEEVLRGLLLEANAQIVAQQAGGGKLANMRSTVVLAVIDMHTDTLLWAHCGDSRAYLFRDLAIVARTSDHSLVQQMVSGGMLDEESARQHPRRNVLLSALGTSDEPPDIDISSRMRLHGGDVLLLCSDGVWEVLGDAGLLSTLQAASSMAQWLALIQSHIAAHAKVGHDNFTALVVKMGEVDDDPTLLMDASLRPSQNPN